ncbi:MAG: STAS domain-containing protein [Gammaproteobacteria bacterium]|nr:STAS domain-containing protein [Gammaproteobacteria bacterium]
MKIIECGESLDITIADKFYTQLADALNSHEPLALNAGQLNRIDGAGLQLLTALFREAHAHAVEVKWEATSAPLITAAKILGVSAVLKLEDTTIDESSARG